MRLRLLALHALLACGPKSPPADSGISDGDAGTPQIDDDPPVDTTSADTGGDTHAPSDTTPVVPPLDTGAVSLRLNEILADPGLDDGDAGCDGAVHTADDEFVEIVNVGDVAVDLTGATLDDDFGVRHRFASGTILAPAEAVVVFGGGTPAACAPLGAGVVLVHASSGALGLGNLGDTVSLVGPAGAILDAYTYGAEGGADTSLVRSPELGDGAMVPHDAAPGAAGNPFSPGTLANGGGFDAPIPVDTAGDTAGDTAVDTAVQPAAQVLIHELLAAPPTGADPSCDGVSDSSADEFVEIVNIGPIDVDLSGATLTDVVAVRHVFAEGTLLASGAAIVVFGGAPVFDGTGPDAWCGALGPGVVVTVASTGLLGLNDEDDTLTLAASDGSALDDASWAAEANAGQSLVRDPELTAGPFVGHLSVVGAVNPWSPGTLASGAALSEPPP